jgi:hypothetical protein
VTIHVDNGPLWVQVLLAVGTMGAAIAAAWAAFAANRSAAATQKLVSLEAERRSEESEDRIWRQARNVHVQTLFEAYDADIPGAELGLHSVVHNDSVGPIRSTRFRVLVEGSITIKRLVGNISPSGERSESFALTDVDPAEVVVECRFIDALDRAWIRTDRGQLRQAEEDLDMWMTESPAG